MILVTGASGHLGKTVAAILVARGAKVRLLVRDAARAPEGLEAEVAVGDYGDEAAMTRALRGVGTAFIVSASAAPGARAKLHASAFAAAKAAGAGHVVYLSLQGASAKSEYPFARDHWTSEESLRACGVPHTVLRNGKYTEQLLGLEMRQGTTLRGASASDRVAWISRADSAKVVAEILVAPPGGIVEYTGPEAITLEETSVRLAMGLGRPFGFAVETPEEAQARVRKDAPDEPELRAELAAGTQRAIAAGDYATVHDARRWLPRVERLQDTIDSGALDELRANDLSRRALASHLSSGWRR
ncbi:MAG: hypothetical protein JWP97_4052 [Labilithrix sp.]|nr:hypothetical protein [Labilithrix sp.]